MTIHTQLTNMDFTRVFKMTFAGDYTHRITRNKKKDRTNAELDEVICWFTGNDNKSLHQEIEDKLMQKIRYIDKQVDELAGERR